MRLLTPKDPEWPLLFQVAEPVTDLVSQVKLHLPEMRAIMRGHNGCGLAAPQVGIPFAFFITESNDPDLEVVINPAVLEYSEQCTSGREGCLSWQLGKPTTYVRRSDYIKAQWTNKLGDRTGAILSGFDARVFQHEYDHTFGKVIFPRPAPTPTPCPQLPIHA